MAVRASWSESLRAAGSIGLSAESCMTSLRKCLIIIFIRGAGFWSGSTPFFRGISGLSAVLKYRRRKSRDFKKRDRFWPVVFTPLLRTHARILKRGSFWPYSSSNSAGRDRVWIFVVCAAAPYKYAPRESIAVFRCRLARWRWRVWVVVVSIRGDMWSAMCDLRCCRVLWFFCWSVRPAPHFSAFFALASRAMISPGCM